MTRALLYLLALGLSVVSGCQTVFGNFSLDSSLLDVSCQLGRLRCAENKLERCARGREWQTLQTCAEPGTCNIEAQSCGSCQAGAFQCNEAQLEECQASSLRWSVKESCASPGLCRIGADGQGACAAPECETPGAHRCGGEHGNELQRCSSQLGWETLENCATAALCDATQADSRQRENGFASCLVPACNPGQFNCDTGTARPCNAQRTGWMDACSTGDCGACTGCSPGAVRCSGAQLLTCTDGAAWAVSQVCGSAFLCSRAGALAGCSPSAGCTPGSTGCEQGALTRCRSDGGVNEQLEQCQSQLLCNATAARCEAPTCREGTRRCSGKQLQTCRADLTGWENTGGPCAESCDAEAKEACTTGPCVPGFRCNDASLEECGATGWQRVMLCASRELCDQSLPNGPSANPRPACLPPACAPGERRCAEPVTGAASTAVQICRPGQDGFRTLDSCVAPEVCDSDTLRCAAPSSL